MKLKKMVKNALKHPALYSWSELQFFRNWLDQAKTEKTPRKKKKKK